MKLLLLSLVLFFGSLSLADGIEDDPCGYVDVEITAGIKDPDFHCHDFRSVKKRQNCKYVYAQSMLRRFGVQRECKVVKGSYDWIFIRKR